MTGGATETLGAVDGPTGDTTEVIGDMDGALEGDDDITGTTLGVGVPVVGDWVIHCWSSCSNCCKSLRRSSISLLRPPLCGLLPFSFPL